MEYSLRSSTLQLCILHVTSGTQPTVRGPVLRISRPSVAPPDLLFKQKVYRAKTAEATTLNEEEHNGFTFKPEFDLSNQLMNKYKSGLV